MNLPINPLTNKIDMYNNELRKKMDYQYSLFKDNNKFTQEQVEIINRPIKPDMLTKPGTLNKPGMLTKSGTLTNHIDQSK